MLLRQVWMARLPGCSLSLLPGALLIQVLKGLEHSTALQQVQLHQLEGTTNTILWESAARCAFYRVRFSNIGSSCTRCRLGQSGIGLGGLVHAVTYGRGRRFC